MKRDEDLGHKVEGSHCNHRYYRQVNPELLINIFPLLHDKLNQHNGIENINI